MKKFYLVDYKGKFTVIQDELDPNWDIVTGEITKDEAIKQASWRVSEADYYGVSGYIGDDPELNGLYK